MKLIKKLLLVSPSLFLVFNYSITMESNPRLKRKSNNFLIKNNNPKRARIENWSFEFFSELPLELQHIIITMYINSGKRGITRCLRLALCSLVSRIFRDCVKEDKALQKLFKTTKEAIKYVQEKAPDEIVKELIVEATKKNLERIDFLILGGADYAQDMQGDTALMISVNEAIEEFQELGIMNRYKEIIKILLNAKADVNICNILGRTALISAAFDLNRRAGCNEEIVKMLLDAGADVNIIDTVNSDTALNMAICDGSGSSKIITMLLSAKANVNSFDNEKWTPLMWAVDQGRLKIVKQLIKKGADVNAINKKGKTALDLAKKQPKIQQLLITAMAKQV